VPLVLLEYLAFFAGARPTVRIQAGNTVAQFLEMAAVRSFLNPGIIYERLGTLSFETGQRLLPHGLHFDANMRREGLTDAFD
jgi:hypothetical protein